eukprot:1810771-Alexandrium_andersonii.AAC.1
MYAAFAASCGNTRRGDARPTCPNAARTHASGAQQGRATCHGRAGGTREWKHAACCIGEQAAS